jgi:membrane protein
MRALRGAFSKFFAADGLFLSAGLAFFSLVTLIPVTLLGVSMLGFVLSSEQAAREVVGQLTRNFPVYEREIRHAMLRIVETRATSGLLGTATLVMFATPLFSASRLVLHRLLGVRVTHGFVRNFVTDATLVLALGVLFFASTLVTWVFHWIQIFVLEPARVASNWIDAANVLFSVTLSTVLFYLGYRYVPRRNIRVGTALEGAVAASLLWEVAKQLFRIYIRRVGVYDQIYGPLGVLVAFVMFVYYTSIVFVFGAAYVAALEGKRR